MLSTNVINKASPAHISEDLRRFGRKHFNQAHKRTSLFGSENEPQYFEDPFRENTSYDRDKSRRASSCFTNEFANKQSAAFNQKKQAGDASEEYDPKQNNCESKHTESHEVLENGNSDYMKTAHENTRENASQSEEEDKKLMNSQQFENSDENPPNHENGNIENEKVDHLIQMAKESTKSKEQDKQNNDENPLSFNTLQRPKVNPEYQRRHLNTPWYTNPEEGLGSADMRRYNSRLVKSIPNSVQEVSKSKSTTQQDFPKYSSQELEECRQIKRYHGNRESVDWTFNEADDSGNQEDKLRRSRYHRSSAVIGEGFMDKFGLKSPLNNKRTNDAPVAASTLRNSPYAFHVQMD